MNFKKKVSAFFISVGIFFGFVTLTDLNVNKFELNIPDESGIILTQSMGKQIINERLLLNDKSVEENSLLAYHYSHYSHYSYSSHYSHSSHYSSYY